MRNYAEETEKRVQYIRQAVADAHADGILFGNSGGKDSALVGILCKMACENTEGIICPAARSGTSPSTRMTAWRWRTSSASKPGYWT